MSGSNAPATRTSWSPGASRTRPTCAPTRATPWTWAHRRGRSRASNRSARVHAQGFTGRRGNLPAPAGSPVRVAGLVAMHDQRPDEEHVEGDDDHGPDGIRGQECELRERVDPAQDDTGDASPRGTGEHPDADTDRGDADDQVDPAPCGDVEHPH